MDYYLLANAKQLELKEREKFLNNNLKLVLSNVRYLLKTNEYNILSVSYGYLFEHIKNDVIKLFSLFLPLEERKELLDFDWINLDYNKKIFNKLIKFNTPDFIYWIFLNIPYFDKKNNKEKRDVLSDMLDYLFDNWPERLYFKEKEFLYITQSTYLTYPLVYHNKNNKNLHKKIAKLNRKICPSLNWENENINECMKNNKIKICFISDSLTCESSVLRDRMGIIMNLSRDQFDVYYSGTVSTEEIIYKVSNEFKNFMVGKYIKLDKNSLDNSRTILKSYNFNIIIYPDIGMKTFQTYLSYSRIAPIQINTWGHSDTSGIDTIDYYISSKYFELEYEKSKEHYSEKLILLDSLSTYYYEPSELFCGKNFKYKTRKELNIPEDENIYWCMQTFYKIDDEFEKKIFGEILKRDKKAKIFLCLNQPFCTSHLKRIENNVGKENVNRIIWFPSMLKENFYNYIKISDVLLDTYPFGGCNTSIEGITFNKPVITLPSNFINGRFTYGFYKKMRINDCIVYNFDDYVSLALKLTSDKDFYNKISNKISTNKNALFEEKKSIDDWSNLLVKLNDKKKIE